MSIRYNAIEGVSMLWRQLRIAWVPFVIFALCTVVAIDHRAALDGTGGSATQGYVQNGRYFLSKGHGAYIETDAMQFALTARRERIVLAALGGMLLSGLAAAFLMRRAGMPLHADEVPRGEGARHRPTLLELQPPRGSDDSPKASKPPEH